MTRNIFHVDFNCFYAAVEMQRRPEIRDKPVAVCGSQEDRHGIVLTANYAAKPFGVRTGMAVWQAKQCCPDLVVLPPDMREYIRISKLARDIYEDYTDQIEPFGLDENWLDVTGSVGLFGSPMTMAREISDRIKFELGKMGTILHTFANGKDPSPVKRSDYAATVKSVGNSATTPRDLVCEEDIHLMLYLLAESVATRMRDLAARCLVVELYVRDTGLASLTRQRKLAVPTCSSAQIAQVAFELFRANYRWEKPVRSIGVRGAELVEADAGVQTSLLDDDAKREKWERIDAAMDHLRQRYGYMSIRRAVTCADPQLGRINPRDDHIIHPVGYFGG